MLLSSCIHLSMPFKRQKKQFPKNSNQILIPDYFKNWCWNTVKWLAALCEQLYGTGRNKWKKSENMYSNGICTLLSYTQHWPQCSFSIQNVHKQVPYTTHLQILEMPSHHTHTKPSKSQAVYRVELSLSLSLSPVTISNRIFPFSSASAKGLLE
jgi:hypothetical protein